MINVMAEAREEEGQDLKIREEGEVVTVLMQHIAAVGNREGMVPVVVGWVSVASFHH